jgi:hypothetical protein
MGARVFLSYSHKDDAHRRELESQLAPLRRLGLIELWSDRDIDAGSEWRGAIDAHLEAADVILLLVSSDFIASAYCYDVEMKRALERHEQGTARVIPVIVRDVDWTSMPFGKLQALPRDGKPVTKWPTSDEGWADVARGVRRVVERT